MPCENGFIKDRIFKTVLSDTCHIASIVSAYFTIIGRWGYSPKGSE